MNVNDFYEKLADLMEEYDAEFDITQYNGRGYLDIHTGYGRIETQDEFTGIITPQMMRDARDGN